MIKTDSDIRNKLELTRIAVEQENPNLGMPLKFEVSDRETIEKLMSVSDLTIQSDSTIVKKIFENVLTKLEVNKFPNIKIVRMSPVVSVEDNFDNLLFTPGNPGRSSTYTRYVDENNVLRTHTSAMVPPTFKELNQKLHNGEDFKDTTFIFPGTVYRRDVIDPRHLDVFHQIDIWELKKGISTREDLLKLAKSVFDAACPNAEMIVLEAKHPYTEDGIEVYAKLPNSENEIEVFEAGLIHRDVLIRTGFDPNHFSGLALGMGIERLIMAQKDLPDIRLIRSIDPRIAKQMETLEKYKEVSRMPPVSRDISFCVSEEDREEDICESIRIAFGKNEELLEEVKIKNRVPYGQLPQNVIKKLGLREKQDNVLVSIILRHPDKTLTKEEVNDLYNKAYPLINKGEHGAGYLNDSKL